MTWRMLKMMTVTVRLSQCGEESCLETGLQLFGRIRWAACRLWSSWKLRRELESDKTIRAGGGAQLTQDNWIWFDIRQLKAVYNWKQMISCSCGFLTFTTINFCLSDPNLSDLLSWQSHNSSHASILTKLKWVKKQLILRFNDLVDLDLSSPSSPLISFPSSGHVLFVWEGVASASLSLSALDSTSSSTDSTQVFKFDSFKSPC